MRCALTALLVFLVLPSCLVAQKTEADLRTRLLKKPLYLRGEWNSDKLAFDAAGHPDKTLPPVSFTLAGVDIRSVKLTAKELVLDGQRVGLEFDKDVPKRVGLVVRDSTGGTSPQTMTIRIQTPTDGDFTAALDAIFVDSLADLVPQFPSYWQAFAQEHLLPPGTSAAPAHDAAPAAAAGTEQPAGTAKPFKMGGPISNPRLLTHVDPGFDNTARAMKYTGTVLVNFMVDATGKTSHFRILHPVGLGLDEQALAAVSQYTFEPAKENGVPVAVELNVEVNFQIF
jgi:TonB family protein